MRRLVLEPAQYGLAFAPIANAPYFVKVETDGQLDLNVAAELAELPKEELLALNPAFNHWVTDPEGPHRVLVPVDREERFVTALAQLPQDQRVRVVYHRVRRGESLGLIASRYGVSVAALRSANGIRGKTIHPGQELLINVAPSAAALAVANPVRDVVAERPVATRSKRHVVRSGETLWSIARRHGVSVASLANRNNIEDSGSLSVGQVLNIPAAAQLASTSGADESLQRLTYVVRRGDTLSMIANRFRVRVQDLLGWNSLRSAHVLKPGQRLVMYVDDVRSGG